jgi:predicted CXXCH cytochrome family protein
MEEKLMIRKAKQLQAKLLVAGAALGVLAFLISCATVNRTVFAPPNVPGATFVGSQTCAECHEEINRDFHTAAHARLRAHGPNALHVGCESCHGPGSLHVESGGAYHTIVNPRRSSEACFQCHLDKRGQFNLPHSHPVLSGKMACADCHDPHRGDFLRGVGAFTSAMDEGCIQCHTQQHGPFIFEHEALREGCTVCHNPHGSVNAKMLVARNASLCLKCHFQHQPEPGRIVIGGVNHTGFLGRGTCWAAGCHEAVHGSRVNSSLRF